jgi:hypothetical protein
MGRSSAHHRAHRRGKSDLGAERNGLRLIERSIELRGRGFPCPFPFTAIAAARVEYVVGLRFWPQTTPTGPQTHLAYFINRWP